MKQNNINYLMVGSFVLAMLLLLIISLFQITGRGSNKDTYYVSYRNITGVKQGTGVSYAGYKIGTVLDIEPVRKDGVTRYRLELGLKPDWQIPQDSSARIVMPGILAEKQINISEGKSPSLLKPGDEIRALASVDLMDLLNLMAGEFQDISDESLKPMIDNISRHVDTIGTELNKNIPHISRDAGELLANLNKTSQQLSTLFNSSNQQRLSNLFINANEMAQSLTRLTSNLDKASTQIEDLLSNSNKLVRDNNDDIRSAVVGLRQSLDVVSQSIDSIVYNLNITSRNMNELSRQVRDNPSLLISGKPPQDKAKE